jgi:hypothetical protein
MRTIQVAALALSIAWFGVVAAQGQTCGNSTIEAPEECDDGGLCIGSANAGTACTSAAQCPDGQCKPFGGDGCAANCTTERDVPYNLVPGVAEGLGLKAGTSGVVINAFIQLPVPISGSLIESIGKERDGKVPVVVKAGTVVFPAIPVLGQACACVHGAAVKTCGGTFLEPDGSQSKDCTKNNASCDGLKPCAFVHGPGNTASGEIGCEQLEGTNLSYSVDAGGETGESQDPVLTLSGTGGPGSAAVLFTIGIDVVLGACTGTAADYGTDGIFCTADDNASIATSATNPLVTGRATALVTNLPDGGEIGPVEINGAPFSCSKLAGGNPGGGSVVTAFAIPDIPTVGPIAVTVELAAQENEGIACVGDCSGDGEVTVDELITMVNIALGGAVTNCPPGDANADGEITVDEIVAAVNKALNGCA